MIWGFYGRSQELRQLVDILERGRWFFARITGRRRIGKTSLVQRALEQASHSRIFYVQIPDSAPAGVLSAVRDAMDTFALPDSTYPRPQSLLELARTVERLAEDGYIVALDEFQYFSRKPLFEFTSYLQARVDALAAKADQVRGGLIVLGSIHADMVALLDDRSAPLFNRTTDHLELQHLDISSVLGILDSHADREPERLLFLWNLFEGVPKFYRDAYEQGVLNEERNRLLAKMYFQSSSPLRTEADNWFLGELRGRYDVVLKYVARHPGCSNGDIEAHLREVSPQTAEQAGGYLKNLTQRYRMLERRLPVFAKPQARKGRYYLRDNFLRSWLAAVQNPVSAMNFRPTALLIDQADKHLQDVEGHGLELLAGQLYEERSRLGIGDFNLTQRIGGYWDRNDTEIDLVALDEDDRVIRFGTCKRNATRLPGDIPLFAGHIERFLEAYPAYRHWRIERVAIAPRIGSDIRSQLGSQDVIAQDLIDLTKDLG